MSFKGDLSTIGLAEVFQMISMSQKEGTLIVQDSDSRKCIFFASTGVELLSSGKRKGLRIGDLLVRTGKITEAQLEEALENARIQRKMVGEVLVENGVVTQEEIQQIVKEQIEEEIYDLFLWKRADFEFVEGPPPENLKDPESHATKLAFDVNGLLLEAVRRADEWAMINQQIPSIDSIFVFSSESDRHEEDGSAGDYARRIYRLVDGKISIAEIVENCGVPKFEVCKVLLDLYSRGRVRLLSIQEQMDLAMRRMADGQREKGLRLYLAAAAQSPNDAKVLAQVAKFLEGEGLGREAASYHVKAGRLFLEQGDMDRALDHMKRAGNANPDDPEIRMGMFEIHAASGNLEEGKAMAKELVTAALMAPDLPRARSLCDRILKADPEDMSFRVLRAKALFRANQRKDLEEDLAWIRKNMPVDQSAANKVQAELQEVLAKRPTTPAPSKLPSRVEGPKAKGKGKGKLVAAVVLLVLLGAGGFAFKYEMDSKKELSSAIEASRGHLNTFAFVEARKGIDAFVLKNLSPLQKERARAFLLEIENSRNTWEQNRKDVEQQRRAAALAEMQGLMDQVEKNRQGNPSLALQRARELRERAEAHRDPEFMRQAEEIASVLEKYLGDAFQLKLRADGLEKEGRLREAALVVEELLGKFPNTEAARGALYPLEIATRPGDVKVTNVRTGVVLGETAGGVLRIKIKPGEAVRLVFDKPGYGSVQRDVKDITAGRLPVDLQEKREQWILPLGVTVAAEPALLGDSLFVAAGQRLYALKVNPRRLNWFESLDGNVEGSPKVGNGLIYVGTAGRGVFAFDPAQSAKRTVWRYEAGERLAGTPGLSADGAMLYAGTVDRMLHAINARTGEYAWKRDLPGEARVEPLPGPGGTILVACDDGTVLALKGPRPEDEAWRLRIDGAVGSLCLAEGVLYATCSDQSLYAIDPVAGRRLWRRHLPPGVSGRPARIGSVVFAACRDGNVFFLDAATGDPQGVFAAQGPILGGVAVSGMTVLFGSDDQFLYALDGGTKTLLWKLNSKGKVRAPPVPGAGTAYFGSDMNLYAVELN